MEIERRKVDELKAAEYNPRKDLRPGDAEYEKLNQVFKSLAMSNQSYGTSERERLSAVISGLR